MTAWCSRWAARCCVRRSRACWNTASTSTPTPRPSGFRRIIAALPTRPAAPGRYTALVVGGGLTGIEAATEICATLCAASAGGRRAGAGHPGRPCRAGRLRHGRRRLPRHRGGPRRAGRRGAGRRVGRRRDAAGRGLSPRRSDAGGDGGVVRRHAGQPLTETCPVGRDRLGRIAGRPIPRGRGTWRRLRGRRLRRAAVDERASLGHVVPARPSDGPLAGHNVVCDLLGEPMLPLSDRLVHDHPRSRRLGCRLYRGLGPPGRDRGRNRPSRPSS